jgi:hypothetical protein
MEKLIEKKKKNNKKSVTETLIRSNKNTERAIKTKLLTNKVRRVTCIITSYLDKNKYVSGKEKNATTSITDK